MKSDVIAEFISHKNCDVNHPSDVTSGFSEIVRTLKMEIGSLRTSTLVNSIKNSKFVTSTSIFSPRGKQEHPKATENGASSSHSPSTSTASQHDIGQAEIFSKKLSTAPPQRKNGGSKNLPSGRVWRPDRHDLWWLLDMSGQEPPPLGAGTPTRASPQSPAETDRWSSSSSLVHQSGRSPRDLSRCARPRVAESSGPKTGQPPLPRAMLVWVRLGEGLATFTPMAKGGQGAALDCVRATYLRHGPPAVLHGNQEELFRRAVAKVNSMPELRHFGQLVSFADVAVPKDYMTWFNADNVEFVTSFLRTYSLDWRLAAGDVPHVHVILRQEAQHVGHALHAGMRLRDVILQECCRVLQLSTRRRNTEPAQTFRILTVARARMLEQRESEDEDERQARTSQTLEETSRTHQVNVDRNGAEFTPGKDTCPLGSNGNATSRQASDYEFDDDVEKNGLTVVTATPKTKVSRALHPRSLHGCISDTGSGSSGFFEDMATLSPVPLHRGSGDQLYSSLEKWCQAHDVAEEDSGLASMMDAHSETDGAGGDCSVLASVTTEAPSLPSRGWARSGPKGRGPAGAIENRCQEGLARSLSEAESALEEALALNISMTSILDRMARDNAPLRPKTSSGSFRSSKSKSFAETSSQTEDSDDSDCKHRGVEVNGRGRGEDSIQHSVGGTEFDVKTRATRSPRVAGHTETEKYLGKEVCVGVSRSLSASGAKTIENSSNLPSHRQISGVDAITSKMFSREAIAKAVASSASFSQKWLEERRRRDSILAAIRQLEPNPGTPGRLPLNPADLHGVPQGYAHARAGHDVLFVVDYRTREGFDPGRPYGFLLVVVDLLGARMWLHPLTSDVPTEVQRALRAVYERHGFCSLLQSRHDGIGAAVGALNRRLRWNTSYLPLPPGDTWSGDDYDAHTLRQVFDGLRESTQVGFHLDWNEVAHCVEGAYVKLRRHFVIGRCLSEQVDDVVLLAHVIAGVRDVRMRWLPLRKKE